MAKKQLTEERKALEKSLTRFDGDIDVEEVTGSPDSKSNASSNHTLLLHTIIEAYCSLVEPNPNIRINLFSEVEKMLVHNRVIDRQIKLDNFLSARRNLAQEFNSRVKEIHDALAPNPRNPILTNEFMATAFPHIFHQNRYFENFEEIKIIAEGGFGKVCLAKHKVDDIEYAVKKIIFKYTSDAAYIKVLREVKSIATLNHLNIVSYYNAWLEALNPSIKCSDGKNSESGSSSDSSDSSESIKFSSLKTKNQKNRCHSSKMFESNDSLTFYKNSPSTVLEQLENHEKCKKILPNSNPFTDVLKNRLYQKNEQSIIFETDEALNSSSFTSPPCNDSYRKSCESSYLHDSVTSSTPHIFRERKNYKLNTRTISHSLFSKDSASRMNSENEMDCMESVSNESSSSSSTSKHPDFSSLLFKKIKGVLYIQMEYCQCDLRLWLDERARGNALPFQKEIKDIFKDILNGVSYIHSKSIIHRDLKPQNIFYSTKDNAMKIGDFGLSTLGITSPSHQKDINTNHSSGLGTVPYAAPEQRNRRNYDSKVDIYSLGIILIELLIPFQTFMEFSKTIGQITKGKIPKELTDKGLDYVNLVKNLIQEKPRFRMSAKEILDLPLIQDGFQIDGQQLRHEIGELKGALKRKEEEMKEVLTEKDNIIKELQNRIKQLTDIINKLERK